MPHNKILSLILLISVLLFVTPCNSLLAAEPVLKADFRHRPPEMVVEGSSISGPLKDILEIAAKTIGYRVEWRIVPFSESLEGLKTGQVDIVPRTLRKPEREAFVSYLGPISIQRKDILFCVPKGKEKRITRYGDLKSMRVGVKPKTAYFEEFDSDTALDKVKADGDQNLARLLVDGKVDAIAVLDRQPLEQAFSQLGFENYTYADFRHAHAIANYYGMSNYSPHANVFDALNQALSILKASGQIDGVFYKYGLTKDLSTVSSIGLTEAEKNWLKEHPGPFRVSNEMGFPPFNFNENGKPKGFSIAYMDLLARKLSIPVDYVSGTSWDGFLKMMRDHDMDIMLNIIRSPERQKHIAFTKPYIHNPIVIVTRKDQIILKQMGDLRGKMVAVPKGFYYQEIIEKGYPNVNLMLANDQGEALRKVATGEADATIGSLAVNNYLISKNFLSNLRVSGIIPGDIMQGDLSIGVRKDWSILAAILQKASNAVTQEEFLRLQEKWLGDFHAADLDVGTERPVGLTPTERAFIQKHGAPIISGAEMDWPPFDFVENEAVSGFSNELLRLAAQKVGLPLDFVSGFTWTELLAKFNKGEIDILPAVYKTPERMKDMAFTKDYAVNPTVLVVQEDSRGLKSLKDLDRKRLATIEGFSITNYLLEKHPEIELLPVKNVLEGLKAVSLKKADAFIGSLGVISYVLSENVIPYVEITDEIVIDQTDATHLHMAVLKDRAVLRDILQKGLDAISVEEMRRLKMKWLPYKFGQAPQSKVLNLSDKERKWLKANKTIKLGIDPVALPFEAISKEGVYEGISSEYVAFLNEKLGVDMRPVTGMNWQEVIAAARNREIDVLPFVAVTQERKEFLKFTKPYIHFQVAAVTRQDAPFIASLKELKGDRVAVVKGYFVYALLKKDYSDLTLVPVDNIEQGLRAVSDGKVAAVVDNSAAIIYHIRKLGLKNLKVAANTPYRPGISFGVRKDWPELVAILDKALETIPEAERERIANRWINIQFADRTDWDFVIKASSAAAVVIVLILGVILFWNRRLAREVGERKRAEERFQAIAATTPGAIVQLRFDADGTPDYLYLSAKAEAFFGKPPQQVINEKCRLPWHPEDAPRVKGEVRANLLAVAEMNHVGRIVPEEGVIRWIRLNASPSRTADGDVIYNGFILDITERKQAEQEFLKSERKIKAMSQAAEDALIMIDGQGKVLFWNPSAERLFGYTEPEAKGMAFHAMAAPKEYHEKIEKGLAHFAQTGQGPVLGTTTEITARNRQGEKFPVEVTLSSFQVDNEWFAVGTVRDITERKKAQDAIKDSERRMADLIDFLPDPILVVDVGGKVVFWNRAMERLTGVKKEDMLGRGNYEYALPFYGERRPILVDLVKLWNPEMEEKYLSVKKEGDCLFSESFHPQLGDGGIYLSGIATVLYDSSGTEVGAIESLRDITESKQATSLMVEKEVAEESAARAEQAKREAEAARKELEVKLAEIERFNQLFLGREERIIELKQQANTLAMEAGRAEPYGEFVAEDFGALTPAEDESLYGPQDDAALDADIFAEVLSVDQFQTLLDDFCQAVGIAAAIIDTKGKVLAAARWQRACTDFHRQNDLTCRRCIESDTELAAQLNGGKPYTIYRCKNGLTDAAAPIIIDGKHLANTFVGQFFTAPPEEEFFRRQAREVDFDREEYLAAIAEVPVVNEDRLPNILGFLVGMSRMVAASFVERLWARQAEELMAQRAQESLRERTAALSLAEDAQKARAEIEQYKGRLEVLVAERTEELKVSEERSRLLLESAGEGIFGVDAKGATTFINPAALSLLGFSESEIMGKAVHSLIHHTHYDGSEYPVEECPMHDSFTKGTSHHVEDEVLWKKDGVAFPVEYASTPIIKEDRVMGAVITFRDITERKETEKELKEQMEDLERFSRLTVDRELKMIQLKEEINTLQEQTGGEKRYKIVE